MSTGEPLSYDEIVQSILGREPHSAIDAEPLSRAKDDVIRTQAAVIDTLRQMVKVQGELIELLRTAKA